MNEWERRLRELRISGAKCLRVYFYQPRLKGEYYEKVEGGFLYLVERKKIPFVTHVHLLKSIVCASFKDKSLRFLT